MSAGKGFGRAPRSKGSLLTFQASGRAKGFSLERHLRLFALAKSRGSDPLCQTYVTSKKKDHVS